MKKLIVYLTPALLVFPVVVSAQTDVSYFSNFAAQLAAFVSGPLTTLLIAAAVLMFIWGVLKSFVFGDSASHEEGRKFMVWAVIAFVVIFSLWGIVRLLGTSLGINQNAPIAPPAVPAASGIRTGQ